MLTHALLVLCLLLASSVRICAQAGASLNLTPIAHPATSAQTHQYLKVSGEADRYRASWIAAVDKNRSIGAPYWPEAFWTEIKTRMKATDLEPMYVAWFQHTVSSDVMQQVLDTYQRVGAEHFQGSAACFKLGETQDAHKSEMDQLTLANTSRVISEVYVVYKPQIKAARVKYMAEHPDWKDN